MRLTEFWDRLDSALTPAYSRSWAHDFVIADLAHRTVERALSDGLDVKEIWRAVHATLELPDRDR